MDEAMERPFLILYTSPSLDGWKLLDEVSRIEHLTVRSVADLDPLEPPPVPSVVLVSAADSPPRETPPGAALFRLARDAGGTGYPEEGWMHLSEGISTEEFLEILRDRWPAMATPLALSFVRKQYDDQALILDQLTEVSLALSTERDYRRLLDLILSRAMLLSGCDAGSLYLIRHREGDERPASTLRFAAARNNSVSLDFRETEIPITKESLAGYVALTGEVLSIDDAYTIGDEAPYGFNKGFDKEVGYRTRSLLVLPMTNHRGEITGVLQLINRKSDPTVILDGSDAAEKNVISFDPGTTRIMRAVGSLAAVAIDNYRLYESIERLFEGFVKASVKAIEQRDPTTSGHSLRVSILTVGLAEAVHRTDAGPLLPFRFSQEQLRELRYAALLHDFGKVGVREQVLVKAKKLYPSHLERVLTRFELARLYKERDVLHRKVDLLSRGGDPEGPEFKALSQELAAMEGDLERFLEVIGRANLPTVLPEGDFSALQEIAARTFLAGDGTEKRLLEPEEVRVLSIRKGSLNEEERLEIESHVTHTYNFLKQIPWTTELSHIPDIAHAHHEKLNGKGYPRGLPGSQIPIQSKIMTVTDIFDALSAADRPYKKAVPVEKALDILGYEVQDGFLDPDLVRTFVEAKIFEKTLHLRAGASTS